MYKSLRSPFSTIKHVIPSTDPSVRYILSYIQSAVCGHSLFSLTFLNALPWNHFKYCHRQNIAKVMGAVYYIHRFR